MERRYGILAAALAVVVACSRLPALFVAMGDAHEPDRVFLGFEADPATAVDLHYYASYVREAREHPSLLLVDHATTEPQQGRVLSLYLSGLGILARISGLSIPAAWNIARVLVALLFFRLLWSVLRLYFPDGGRRFLTFALVAVGGGLGWLMVVLRALFGEHAVLHLADLHKDGVIGYNTFGYLYHPQALLGQSCFLASVLLWSRWRASLRVGWLGGALACALLIFAAHGPSAPVFYLALLFSPVIPLLFRWEFGVAWRRLRAVAAFAIPAALAAGYVLWARGDLVYRGFADTYAQLFHLREPFFWYPLGYGLVFLLAIPGLSRVPTDDGERRDFLLGWLLAALIAALNPLVFAWKFQFALHIPLCILAVFGAPFAWERITQMRLLARFAERPALGAALLLIVSSLSSVLLFGGTLAHATNDVLFTSRADADAFAFLAKQPPGNLLGRYRTGYLSISQTPHRAYLAHYTGTLNPARKDDQVRTFYSVATPVENKRAILDEGQIRYVFQGPREKEIGQVDPALGLRPIYDQAGVRIFEVPR